MKKQIRTDGIEVTNKGIVSRFRISKKEGVLNTSITIKNEEIEDIVYAIMELYNVPAKIVFETESGTLTIMDGRIGTLSLTGDASKLSVKTKESIGVKKLMGILGAEATMNVKMKGEEEEEEEEKEE